MDPKVSAVHSDQRLAQFLQGGFATGSELLLSGDHSIGPAIFQSVEAMDTGGIVANTRWRLLSHLDLGNQIALRGVPPREPDASHLADDAAI
jgi:hypothetical protein